MLLRGATRHVPPNSCVKLWSSGEANRSRISTRSSSSSWSGSAWKSFA
jgi:hypothetical protein